MKVPIENLKFSIVDKRLAHLSPEETVNLMERYYAGETVSKLIKEFNIEVSASQLYATFPPVDSNEKCVHCRSTMLYPWGSKSWSNSLLTHQMYCSQCNHEEKTYCSCEYCKKAREEKQLEEEKIKREEEEKKRLRVLGILEDDTNWPLLKEDELTLEDRVYLATILRAGLSEDTTYINSFKELVDIIAPTPELSLEIIKTLTGRDLIVPSVNSQLSAFEVTDEGIKYATLKVQYRLNLLPCDYDEEAMIKRLMYPDPSIFADNKEFCFEMWKKIALNESLQYLLFQMNKVGYSFNPGDKTLRVFENLLEYFSTSQIYNIIYRAVANSTTRYQSGEITKIHAQNSVITSCEKQGERAIAEGWTLKGYGRLRELPATILSEVFFTSIMKIAYLGFSEKPTIKF